MKHSTEKSTPLTNLVNTTTVSFTLTKYHRCIKDFVDKTNNPMTDVNLSSKGYLCATNGHKLAVFSCPVTYSGPDKKWDINIPVDIFSKLPFGNTSITFGNLPDDDTKLFANITTADNETFSIRLFIARKYPNYESVLLKPDQSALVSCNPEALKTAVTHHIKTAMSIKDSLSRIILKTTKGSSILTVTYSNEDNNISDTIDVPLLVQSERNIETQLSARQLKDFFPFFTGNLYIFDNTRPVLLSVLTDTDSITMLMPYNDYDVSASKMNIIIPSYHSLPDHGTYLTDETPAPTDDTPDISFQDLTFYYKYKQKHPDSTNLIRKGNVYTTYNEDAKTISDILGITLTTYDRLENPDHTKVMQSSFPYHALDTYLPKLIRAGKRVAITCADGTSSSNKPKQKLQPQSSSDTSTPPKSQPISDKTSETPPSPFAYTLTNTADSVIVRSNILEHPSFVTVFEKLHGTPSPSDPSTYTFPLSSLVNLNITLAILSA